MALDLGLPALLSAASSLKGMIGQFGGQDSRQHNPRFSGENLTADQNHFARFRRWHWGITPAQLALAWLLNQRDDIVAMCLTRKLDRIDENTKAIGVELNAEALRHLAQACFARPWFVARSRIIQDLLFVSSAASRSCMNAS